MNNLDEGVFSLFSIHDLFNWRAKFVKVVAAILLAGPLLAWQDAGPKRPPTPPERQLPPGGPKPGQAYVNFHVSRPIGAEDFERLKRMLNLHEAQAQFVADLYKKYQEADDTIRRKGMPALWEKSGEIGAGGNLYANPRLADEYAELIADRNRLMERIAANEDQLLNNKEPILAEVQLLALQRARDLRVRSRCRCIPFEYPGSQIDLTEILDNLQTKNEFDPKDREAFDAVLAEFESHATTLLKHYNTAWFDAAVKAPKQSALAQASIPPGADPTANAATQARVQAAYEEIMRLNGRFDEIAKKLHDLNAQYVDRIAALLPGTLSQEFKTAFQVAAYPPVYPNPFDLEPILKEMIAISSLSAVQSEALKAIATDYQQHVNSLSNKMTRRFVDYKKGWLKHRHIDREEFGVFKNDMQAIQEERKELASLTLKQVKDLLEPKQWEEIEQKIKAYEVSAAAHKSKESGFDLRP